MQTHQTLVIGAFRVDLANEQLRRGQEIRQLKPKAFEVLRYLVTHPGQLITKEAFLDAVWPEAYVSDAALTVCIRELRQAFEDNARAPTFIETVHRRGYRFIAPVRPGDPLPARYSSSPSPASESFPSALEPASLIGRKAEWTQVQQWLATAIRGERQVGFITGEAGIGKTTLVDAFVSDLDTEETLWVGYGQCLDHYGVGEAYMPLLEAFGRLCRGPSGAHAIEVLDRQAPSWLLQMPALFPPADQEALQRRARGSARERMLRELAEAVEVLTAERPLVLVLEDLHWSDVSTLDWLAYIARRREPARLLVLGTYRPVDVIVRSHPLHQVKHELHS